jgi:hypothetical protein
VVSRVNRPPGCACQRPGPGPAPGGTRLPGLRTQRRTRRGPRARPPHLSTEEAARRDPRQGAGGHARNTAQDARQRHG